MSALHFICGRARFSCTFGTQQTGSLLLGLVALWLFYPHRFEWDAKSRKEPERAQFKKQKNRKNIENTG